MSDVAIHDTHSGSPVGLGRAPGEPVGIYACGPTVYGRIHVGNARPFVVFSLLKRYLAYRGYPVTLVVNVTDINDKIYAAAVERGIPSGELAAEMSAAYRADTDGLGLGRPDREPLATESIGAIVELIGTLLDTGRAYTADGDVYFSVRGFESYGSLSNRPTADMDQGEEAGEQAGKRDPLDFALWKARKPGEDTCWPAPWGEGRPGWHIECSAMAQEQLGMGFDIHGGGSDLVFPHHENEIAQSEAAHPGERFARIWMHNGMLQLDAEKMSKSEGNIFQLSEALERFGAEALIAYFVSGHYRKPIEFSAQRVAQAHAGLDRIRNYLRTVEPVAGEADPEVAARRAAFDAALADDFNTPQALTELHALVGEGFRRPVAGAHALLAELLPVLGLHTLLERGREPDDQARRLLAERQAAREQRDFATSDRLRDELAARGWDVRDGAGGAELVPRGS
ncbi:MAG: cysteine--tRNA ligase [Solirubrobacterales bacterium]